MVEKHGIMFQILHKLNPFGPIRDPEISDIMLILLSMFFRRPCNYYDCKKVSSVTKYGIPCGEKHSKDSFISSNTI